MQNNHLTPKGDLLILLPGLGAVSSTLMAGVELARRGLGQPFGSMTQMGTLEVDGRSAPLREVLPLASLDQIHFAAWDITPEDAAQVAQNAEVLQHRELEAAREFLARHAPMPGAHDPAVLQRIEATHTIEATHSKEKVQQLRRDIQRQLKETGASRAVMVFLTSTERRQRPSEIHQSLQAFEAALEENHPAITPTQLYAYAAIMEHVPVANGTPNLGLELPCFLELAAREGVPMAGKDLKTGQTMLKTALAPAFKSRQLGVRGWFSTNILGNLDGEVLDDEAAFKSKEETKENVLSGILQPESNPELYGDLYHKVRINYYPPRGDQKEGWDNIDIFGWLGYSMQIKVDFLCRDSILAAPIVLDLALFLDLAARQGQAGLQEWLSFYFKAPVVDFDQVPEHDLFRQRDQLERTLLGFVGYGD
jgi:myo-inositol-1-phosphate synthase